MFKAQHPRIFKNFPWIFCGYFWNEEFSNVTADQSNASAGDPIIPQIIDIKNEITATAEQIHGNRVEKVTHAGFYRGCDGLICHRTNLNIVIRTADCAAVMIFDPDNNIIVNLHAGWRGVHGDIVKKGLKRMVSSHGCDTKKFFVAIGPSLHSCCYQVGEEFNHLFSDKFLLQRNGRLFLNLNAAILHSLLESGIPWNHIEMNKNCTCCSQLNLPSYRRSKTSNRMINIISLKERERVY